MNEIAFFSNRRAPYRTLQLKEFAKIPGIHITVYYYEAETRAWSIEDGGEAFDEVNLQSYRCLGVKKHKKFFLHHGLDAIVRKSDIIMSGSYTSLSDMVIINKAHKYGRPFILLMDGFVPTRIGKDENPLMHRLKADLLKKTAVIFGNGTVSRQYFTTNFNYPADRIVNQVLTVDIRRIEALEEKHSEYRREIRNRYGIPEDSFVVQYSGRLMKLKRVDFIAEAIGEMPEKTEITFFITGDGEEKKNIEDTAAKYDEHLVLTGFIKDQEELFKMYYASDCLVFATEHDTWGLSVMEAMAAGLPVICSEYCGVYMDLVKNDENGYTFSEYDTDKLADLIRKAMYNKDRLGKRSREMIQDWTFEKSRENFEKVLKTIKSLKEE